MRLCTSNRGNHLHFTLLNIFLHTVTRVADVSREQKRKIKLRENTLHALARLQTPATRASCK